MKRIALLLVLALAGCGTADTEPPPPPRATQVDPATTYVSDDGVRFLRGPARMTPELEAARWREVAFEGGELRLGRFERCLDVDHVQIGPPDGNLRRVSVLGRDPGRDGTCTREIAVRTGSGWTVDTIAAPMRITSPDPGFTGHQETAEADGLVLQADRRTVLGWYSHAGCQALARATAERSGNAVTMKVTVGSAPRSDGSCAESLKTGMTMARLDEPAPPGVVVGQ